MLKKHFPFFLVFSLIFTLPLFSAEIISPVNGNFANRQSLVINLLENEEAYYSYTNSNPLNSGFAYDGPVLIDAGGDVNLFVTVVKNSGKGESENFKIKYTVAEELNPYATGSAEKLFIDRVLTENILSCSGNEVISIPDSLLFSIGDGEKPFLKGTTLSVSSENRLFRYIPCTVTNGEASWRFIIFLNGQAAGSFSQIFLPFEFSDWETLVFTGKNLIWSLDKGLWSASKNEIKIDRSKTHVLYWQDVAYKDGNPIQSFVLAPKPKITTKKNSSGISFSIDGDSRYRMKVSSSGAAGEAKIDSGLYAELTFDTFSGDFIEGQAILSLYLDGVFQGNILKNYVIDKQPPLKPKFIASEVGEYARKDVKLKIESEKDAKIYVSLYGPFEAKSTSYLDNKSEFDYIKPDKKDFVQYKNQEFNLRAGTEKTVSYKAFSYAEDSFGNVSEISTYKVTIDEYNYFLDGEASSFVSDGSRLHPYTSFEQALKAINSSKFVHIFVSGTVRLSDGANIISSNCSFTGINDARLVLPSNSYIFIKDSSIELQNCIIQKEISSTKETENSQKLFVLEKGAANFTDCEISGNFLQSAIAFMADASIIDFENSGLTVKSPTYACCFSGNNSRFLLENSHFASISDTAVNFSVKGGSFILKSSDCQVISHLGRIIESTGANLKLVSNSFTGDFDKKTKGVTPIWKDEKTMILENKDNKEKGF